MTSTAIKTTFTFASSDATTTLSLDLGNVSRVIERVRYKPGWRLSIHAQALSHHSLRIELDTIDSATGKAFVLAHLFPIPPGADYGWAEDAIEDWIFERIIDVERHEAGEFFRVDELRPFMPEHGYGSNPYNVRRRAHPES